MDLSGDAIVMLLLFVGLFLSWIKALISTAIAIVVRNRILSIALALIVGALQGLVGTKFELLDLYLTRAGWEAIDALALITVALSALASLAWWMIARAVDALVRRILRDEPQS